MNRHALWIFPLLAMGAVYLMVTTWSTGKERSAEDLLVEFEAELASEEPNMEAALLKIDYALEFSARARDRELQATILKRRAKLYRDLGRRGRAREDYELLLRRFTPDDKDAIRLLAQLEFEDGEEPAALARINAVLAEEPNWPTGLFIRAGFRLDMSDAVLESAAEVCSSVMDDAAAERAIELTRMIAARVATEPRRAAMMHEVSRLFPTGSELERRSYNDLVLRASELVEEAFGDYSLALERSNNVTSITGVLEILNRSGRYEDAAAYAVAALQHLASTNYKHAAVQFLASLRGAGWDHEAIRFVPLFLESGQRYPREFLEDLLATSFYTRDWERMRSGANQLRQLYPEPKKKSYVHDIGAEARALAHLYGGLAAHHLGIHKEAVYKLGKYRETPRRPTPFPDALLLAETARAASAGEMPGAGSQKTQAIALRTALVLRRDAAGEDWLRLYRLQRTQSASPGDLEKTLGHLLAAFPDRAGEFEPAWRANGKQSMNQAFLNLSDMRRQLAETDQLVPEENLGSYANFKLAEQYAAEREWYGVLAACDQAFAAVPFLTPAVNLYLQACSKLGLDELAVELLLGRLEHIGLHEPTLARLGQLRDLLSPEQELLLMRVDPRGLGRNTMVRALLDSRQFEQARSALTAGDGETELMPEGHLLLGEALLGLERYDEALLSLRRVPAGNRFYPRAYELILEGALATGNRPLLDATIAELDAPSARVESGLTPILDKLLVAGEFGLARDIAALLDSSPATRSGENMLRVAALDLRAGEYVRARESLERAYAYVSDGGPAVGHLLTAILEEDWASVPRLIADFEDERQAEDAELSMVLALLRGRPQVVRDYLAGLDPQAAARGLPLLFRSLLVVLGEDDSPLLEGYSDELRQETERFLSGTAEAPHDPRQVLGLLLALQHPQWRVWMIGELERWRALGANLWADFLEAECLLRLESLRRADQVISRFVATWPDFLPAWELANRLQFLQPLADAELIEFAKYGWQAPGHPGALGTHRRLEQIAELRSTGETAEALRVVRSALDASPDEAPLLYQLARIHQEDGNYEAALIAMGRFLRVLPPRARDAVLPEMLEILELGFASRAIDPEQRRLTLEGFSRAYPRNALVAVQLAESDLYLSIRRNPTGAIYDAFARLGRFRVETDRTPIAELGAGGLRAWHQFHLELDPRRAEEFIRAELEQNPRIPELWAMLAECLEAQGRRNEADRELELLLSIAPDERALELWIASLIRRGESLQLVNQACHTLATLRGWEFDHPRLEYWRARAKANGPREEALEGVAELQTLWDEREAIANGGYVERPGAFVIELGRHYGVSAMRAGDTSDHSSAQKAFRTLASMALPPEDRRLYSTLALIGPNRNQDPTLPERRAPGAKAGQGDAAAGVPGQPQAKFTPEQIEELNARRLAQGKPAITPEDIARRQARAAQPETSAPARTITPEQLQALNARREKAGKRPITMADLERRAAKEAAESTPPEEPTREAAAPKLTKAKLDALNRKREAEGKRPITPAEAKRLIESRAAPPADESAPPPAVQPKLTKAKLDAFNKKREAEGKRPLTPAEAKRWIESRSERSGGETSPPARREQKLTPAEVEARRAQKVESQDGE